LEIKSGTNELLIYVNGGQGYVGKVSDGDYSTSLVKSGTGTLILGVYAVWSYTGDTIINEGTMDQIMNNLPHGYGKGNLVVNANGTAGIYGSYVAINGLSNATAVGGIVRNNYTGSSSDRLDLGNNNATASFSGAIQGVFGVIKSGNGTQTFSGVNTYSGGTILSNGVLSVSSTNNIGGANAKVTFAGGTLRITGTTFTNFGAAPLTFTSAGGGLDIADAGNSFTLTNNLASGTVLTKTGAGRLVVSGSVSMLVTDSRALVSGSGSVADWTLKSLTGGSYTPAGPDENVTGNLTLEGNYTFRLNSDGSGDKLTATGAVTMNNIVITISVPENLTDRSKVYTLVKGLSLFGNADLAPTCVLPQDWKLKKIGNELVVKYVSPGTMVSFF
jgi:autotransporter-associated beta strand protein